jgi:hypothetical protein
MNKDKQVYMKLFNGQIRKVHKYAPETSRQLASMINQCKHKLRPDIVNYVMDTELYEKLNATVPLDGQNTQRLAFLYDSERPFIIIWNYGQLPLVEKHETDDSLVSIVFDKQKDLKDGKLTFDAVIL